MEVSYVDVGDLTDKEVDFLKEERMDDSIALHKPTSILERCSRGGWELESSFTTTSVEMNMVDIHSAKMTQETSLKLKNVVVAF